MCMYLPTCLCVHHMSTGAQRSQKKVSDPPRVGIGSYGLSDVDSGTQDLYKSTKVLITAEPPLQAIPYPLCSQESLLVTELTTVCSAAPTTIHVAR